MEAKRNSRSRALLISAFVAGTAHGFRQAATLDGITFASSPGKLLVPVRDVGEAFGLTVHYDSGQVWMGNKQLSKDGPMLPDGTRIAPVRDLAAWNIKVRWDAEAGKALLEFGDKQVYVRVGDKQVNVDKSRQELVAVQGNRVVMKTPISSGRRGHRTPNGTFAAGPYKARMHRSSLYDDAPMPHSVQVTGNIFIHGYSSVPGVPASHGCIRVPTKGSNPAKFFYDWVEVGTPIEIAGRWSG